MQSSLQNRVALRLLALILFIFGLNSLGSVFGLYYLLWWYDMPMHFLGGAFLGILFIYLAIRFKKPVFLKEKILYGIFFVCLIGILWELFELNVSTFIVFNPQHPLDTISDLCFDLAGGAVALVYIQGYLANFSPVLPKDATSV